MENNKILDKRGRNVLGTITRHDDGSYRFTCKQCDGEFLTSDTCLKHIDLVHVKINEVAPCKM